MFLNWACNGLLRLPSGWLIAWRERNSLDSLFLFLVYLFLFVKGIDIVIGVRVLLAVSRISGESLFVGSINLSDISVWLSSKTVVAVRAYAITDEMYLAAMWATDNFPCYLYSAAWADRCFIADLMTAFWTFDYHNGLKF